MFKRLFDLHFTFLLEQAKNDIVVQQQSRTGCTDLREGNKFGVLGAETAARADLKSLILYVNPSKA